jgi:hypothetical protein
MVIEGREKSEEKIPELILDAIAHGNRCGVMMITIYAGQASSWEKV